MLHKLRESFQNCEVVGFEQAHLSHDELRLQLQKCDLLAIVFLIRLHDLKSQLLQLLRHALLACCTREHGQQTLAKLLMVLNLVCLEEDFEQVNALLDKCLEHFLELGSAFGKEALAERRDLLDQKL